jgi:hypothetical protein
MTDAVTVYLNNPNSPWAKFRLWLHVTWPDVRDYFLRFIYAQHNARVLADFENRMVAVIYQASGGMMSKPYYTEEAMLQCIREAERKAYDYAYADGRSDLAAELGVEDPSPVVPE